MHTDRDGMANRPHVTMENKKAIKEKEMPNEGRSNTSAKECRAKIKYKISCTDKQQM